MGVKMTTHFATPSPTTPNNFLLPLPDRALLYAPSPLPGSTTPPNSLPESPASPTPSPRPPPLISSHIYALSATHPRLQIKLQQPQPDLLILTMIRRDAPEPAFTTHCYDEVVTDELWDLLQPRPNKGFETGQGTAGPPLYPGFCLTGIGRECVIIFGLLQRVFQ